MARGRTSSDPALPVVGPDASVMRALRAAGAKEVEIPGAPSWWILPGQDQARTWQEAIHWIGECVGAQRRAQLVKPFHLTSEFWLATASFLGVAGTALTSLADTGFGGPLAPYLMPVAGVLAAIVPIGYKFARAKAKSLAAQELEGKPHAHQQPAKARHEEDRGPTG